MRPLIKRHAAFTLIEILVVLIILSIIGIVSALSLSYFDQQQRAKRDAEQLQQLVHFASDLAVLQQHKIALTINRHAYFFSSFKPTLTSAWTRFKHGPLSQRFTSSHGLNITSSITPIIFYADQTNTKATLNINDDNEHQLLRLNLQPNGLLQTQVLYDN